MVLPNCKNIYLTVNMSLTVLGFNGKIMSKLAAHLQESLLYLIFNMQVN